MAKGPPSPSPPPAAAVAEEEASPTYAEGVPFLPQTPSQAVHGIPTSSPIQSYVITPLHCTRLRRPRCCRCTCCLVLPVLSIVLFLFSAIFFLWPSNPDLHVVRVQLDRIHAVKFPIPHLDISMDLEVRVHNRAFLSLDYTSLVTTIGYRGKQLGLVTSGGGRVKARGISYVQMKLDLNGVRIIEDVLYLMEDLASGTILFDTVTKIDGTIHLLFVDAPIKGRISCSVNVNTKNHTTTHQDCHSD